MTRSSHNHLSHSISTTHYHCALLYLQSTFLWLIAVDDVLSLLLEMLSHAHDWKLLMHVHPHPKRTAVKFPVFWRLVIHLFQIIQQQNTKLFPSNSSNNYLTPYLTSIRYGVNYWILIFFSTLQGIIASQFTKIWKISNSSQLLSPPPNLNDCR